VALQGFGLFMLGRILPWWRNSRGAEARLVRRRSRGSRHSNWEETMGDFGAALVLFLVIFGIVLAIAWIILPFALIGTKPLLRELITETRKNNALLERIATKD
jgi:hypothetical protein